MSDHGPGVWIKVTLNDMFPSGRGYLNFYSHRTKESHRFIHLSIILVETLGRWVTAKGRNLFCRLVSNVGGG
jgi:hypothetical protein